MSRDALRLSLRRFALKEAAVARARLDAVIEHPPAHFDRGYFLGQAHAYELIVKYKLNGKAKR